MYWGAPMEHHTAPVEWESIRSASQQIFPHPELEFPKAHL